MFMDNVYKGQMGDEAIEKPGEWKREKEKSFAFIYEALINFSIEKHLIDDSLWVAE